MERDESTRRLEAAQEALLARFAPETRVRRVAWSQGKTQVLELGDGPPLLLVHGGGDAAFEWAPILAPLARTHRALAVDRPGHGLADPFDYAGVDLLDHARTFLREVLDALELERAAIVANSMGGLWAVTFALDAPDRVSRLALVGAPPGVNRAVPLPLRLFGLPLVGRPLLRRLVSDPTPESSRRFWGKLLVAHPERLDDTLLATDVAHMRRNAESVVGLMSRVATLGGLRRHLILGDRWQALGVPTLALLGERDAFLDPGTWQAWEAIAARNPAIRVARVPDAGHLPWIDEPERVVGELEHFLATPPIEQRRTA
ncbi:MAG TPA: alpha/beta fold hydrolase [Gaiella sp.]|jgi:pimeloyl-ACP methyl ester carboxylesterase